MMYLRIDFHPKIRPKLKKVKDEPSDEEVQQQIKETLTSRKKC